MGGGGGSSSSSMKSTTRSPWGESAGYFGPMYSKAWDTIQSAMSQGSQPFQGNWRAEVPAHLAMAANTALARAGELSGQGADDLTALGRKTAQGGFLPSSEYKMNPQLQNIMDIAAGRTKEQFTQGILPNIRDAAIAGGAYGGARQDIQENQASQQFSRAANEATQQIGYQDYNDFQNRYSQMWNSERERMQGSGNILAAADREYMAPALAKVASGEYAQQYAQTQTDNMLQRWMDQHRVAPGFGFNMLTQFPGMLTAGDYGTTTEVGQSKQKSGGGGALDMFKTGAGLLGSIASMGAK